MTTPEDIKRVTEPAKCELCGEPMPPNEQMFKFHGYSGPCPKPVKSQEEIEKEHKEADKKRVEQAAREGFYGSQYVPEGKKSE